MSEIDTVVLMMAGKGTRDQPHSFNRPNTFGEVGNTNPFMIITQGLAEIGMKNLVVVVRDLDIVNGTNMGEHFASETLATTGTFEPENVHYVVQDPNSYGTAASVAAAIPTLREMGVDGFGVVNSDGFTLGPRRHPGDTSVNSAWDLQRAIAKRQDMGADHALVTTPVERIETGVYDYGLVRHSKHGHVLEVIEKASADKLPKFPGKGPKDTLDGNAGTYVFGKKMLDVLEGYMSHSLEELGGRPEYWLTDLFALARSRGHYTTSTPAEGIFIDCATREKRDKAQIELVEAGIPIYPQK